MTTQNNRLEHIAKLLVSPEGVTDGEVLDSIWRFLVDICDINPEYFRDVPEGKCCDCEEDVYWDEARTVWLHCDVDSDCFMATH